MSKSEKSQPKSKAVENRRLARNRISVFKAEKTIQVIPRRHVRFDVNLLPVWQQASLIALFVLISTAIFFVPYAHHFDFIYRYWDGPNYAWVAKTFYSPSVNNPLSAYGSTAAYFACHLPFYPILIRALSFFGYFEAMIITTVMCSMAAAIAFYFFLKDLKLVSSPFWTSLFLIFLPTRYFIYQHVGATEPLFILLLITSMHAFAKDRLNLAVGIAALASITRITGILMIPVFAIMLISQKRWKDLWKLCFIGLPLLLTFAFYQYKFGDFWAYFSWNHGLMHAIPMDVMRIFAATSDGRSSEFFIALYAIYGIAVFNIRKINTQLFAFGIVYYCFSIFIFHGDLSRYFLPLAPFTFLIAFDSILKTREFKTFYLCVILPMTYVYSFAQLDQNLCADWVYQNLLKVM